MYKKITFLFLSMAYASIAGAHTLGPEAGVPAQVWHELLGIHHLPLTLLLVVVGVIAYRKLRARKRS